MSDAQPSLFDDLPPAKPPKVVKVRPYTRVLPGHRQHPAYHEPDVAATAAATEASIDEAEQHADEQWKAIALAAVGWCAKHYELFTADEVWTRLTEFPDVGTHEPAALGPIFLKAAKADWIVKTNETRKRSQFKQRHRELTVWASKVYVGPHDGEPR